jgi:hypothetical protein
LPGIAFTASGRAWIRQDRATHAERLTPQKGRAVVLAEIYQQASTATTTFLPEEAFPAQQKLTTLFGEWQDIPSHIALRFRASFTLCLAPADSARAAQFDEARRAARLQDTIMEDRMAFLRRVALRDESSALLWWLSNYIEKPDPMTSWEVFDNRVRPLTLGRGPGSGIAAGVIRVAEALISQLSGDATRLANFLGISAHIVRTSGYEDLAAELANLAAQAHPPPPRSLPPGNSPRTRPASASCRDSGQSVFSLPRRLLCNSSPCGADRS